MSLVQRAYDDVYDGIIGVYSSNVGPAYGGSGTGATNGRPQVPAAGFTRDVCTGQTAGVTDWRINEIGQAVDPLPTVFADREQAEAGGTHELRR